MNEIPPPGIPVDLYTLPLKAVEFLRRSGPPDELARVAERLEAFAEAGPFSDRLGPHFQTSADLARLLERQARDELRMLETFGMEFNFHRGVAKLAGSKRTTDASVISAALEDLYSERKLLRHDSDTYGEVRERLAHLFGAEAVERITDGQIRGAVHKRNKRLG